MNAVSDMIRGFSGSEVATLLNEGNKGDGLIHMGGRRLFSQHKVRCTEIQYPAAASGHTLFVYGCGGFSRAYNHMVDYLGHYLGKFDQIIVLPASFDVSCERVRAFLAGIPKNMTIYCRERYSYEQVLTVVPSAETVYLDHDLAFHLDFSVWKVKGRGRLLAFRTDAESPGVYEIAGNRDISQGDETMGESLLQEVSRYEEVHTNRAHVAIAAAMMEKRTFVYPSIYHKQKGIYQYSLAHLPRVAWIESATPILET
jgi:exopolysaccharide biosynthesis predicted pyruvyltransferase EpsI